MNELSNWASMTFYQKAQWLVNTRQYPTFDAACRELQRRGMVARKARRKAAPSPCQPTAQHWYEKL